MRKVLLIPKIKIQNANALSSPYTIGFPAMTAWSGGVHALQRKLNAEGYNELVFKSTAVVCHHMNLQTYKGKGDYVHSIVGTGNPLKKDGKRPSTIEEARCHLQVSLVIEYENLPPSVRYDEFLTTVQELLYGKLKLAGGDILSTGKPEIITVSEAEKFRHLKRRLMPGYTLIERRDLMINAMKEGKDAITALLEHLTVTYSCEQDEAGKVTWHSKRKEKGWIVPIATGFHGITPLGRARSQRDPTTPHRFAESIVTLGEFKMPCRIQEIDDMLWHYHTDTEKNLYLCQQNNQPHN